MSRKEIELVDERNIVGVVDWTGERRDRAVGKVFEGWSIFGGAGGVHVESYNLRTTDFREEAVNFEGAEDEEEGGVSARGEDPLNGAEEMVKFVADSSNDGCEVTGDEEARVPARDVASFGGCVEEGGKGGEVVFIGDVEGTGADEGAEGGVEVVGCGGNVRAALGRALYFDFVIEFTFLLLLLFFEHGGTTE